MEVQKTSIEVQKTSIEVQKTTTDIQEMSRKLKDLGQNVYGLNTSVGGLIETLIAAKLWEKFSDYPYMLQRAYKRIPIYDENNNIVTDIDILLVDTDYAMAVEVKLEPDQKDIKRHILRMEQMRKYPPLELKASKLLGAIAGGFVSPDAREFAHNAGFFVLELTGESVTLAKPPKEFIAKEW
jgi:predicted AAA+ superfamily ATPase